MDGRTGVLQGMLLCDHAMMMSLDAFVGCGLYGFVGGEEDRHSLGGERGRGCVWIW